MFRCNHQHHQQQKTSNEYNDSPSLHEYFDYNKWGCWLQARMFIEYLHTADKQKEKKVVCRKYFFLCHYWTELLFHFFFSIFRFLPWRYSSVYVKWNVTELNCLAWRIYFSFYFVLFYLILFIFCIFEKKCNRAGCWSDLK